MVFKGGTSLTKCYQLLDRFSEDIDLSYSAESGSPGEGRRRKLKKVVTEAIDSLGLVVSNLEETRSRRHYNCYRAAYDSIFEKSEFLKSELVVETYVALLPFPSTTRMVDNYLYRFLVKINRLDIAEEFDLMPFAITTQAVERTLVDKVFALCDYYITGKTDKHSRHIYDIHRIVNSIVLNNDFKDLVREVRKDRSTLAICPSAQDDVNVSEVLNEIIYKKVYESDYNNVTAGLLFIPVSYDTAIESLKRIIESGIFD